MNKQHVGSVSDTILEDDVRSAARAQQENLKALARPQATSRGPRHDYGNGDPCPTNPEHGHMYVLKSGSQYCAHSEHVSPKDQTRCVWPA